MRTNVQTSVCTLRKADGYKHITESKKNSFNKSLLGLTHQQAAFTRDEPTDLRRQLAALRLLSTIKTGNIDVTSKPPQI